jgi:hypothetical protein
MKKLKNILMTFSAFIFLCSCKSVGGGSDDKIQFNKYRFPTQKEKGAGKYYLKEVTLTISNDEMSATISHDYLKNEGEFIGKEGSFDFDISYLTLDANRSYDIVTTISSLTSTTFSTQTHSGEHFVANLIPSLYIIETKVTDSQNPQDSRILKTSLVVQCENSIKTFNINPSNIVVSPVAEINYNGIPRVFGNYTHNLSNIVTNPSGSLSDFIYYIDRQGDTIIDDTRPKSILTPTTLYSNFADSNRSLRYKVFDRCFNYEDFVTPVASAFGATEKENFSIDSATSAMPPLLIQFLQAKIQNPTGDPRLNGIHSYILHNKPHLTVQCQYTSGKIVITAKELLQPESTGTNNNLTGTYDQILNLTGISANGADLNANNAKVSSLSVSIPGEGDNKISRKLSGGQCGQTKARLQEISVVETPCAPNYEGEGTITKRYRVFVDYHNCNIANGSVTATITDGELLCDLANSVGSSDCRYNGPVLPPGPGPIPTPPNPNPPVPGEE